MRMQTMTPASVLPHAADDDDAGVAAAGSAAPDDGGRLVQRHGCRRRPRRPRQEGPAGDRPDGGRLRGDRGRRAADRRLVPPADAGGARIRASGCRRRDARRRTPALPHTSCRGDRRLTWRGVGGGARVRSAVARFAPVHQARRRPLHRQGQRERARRRHLRHRLGARGAAAIHARRRGTAGDAREGRHAHRFAGLRDAGGSTIQPAARDARSRTRWRRSARVRQPQVRRRARPAPTCRWRRCSSACPRRTRCSSATSRATAR